MRRRLLVTALATVLTVISAGVAAAITWGEPDGEGHPHVVQLLFVQNGDGYYGCSGTLLSPYVVLTAGHCTGWIDANGVQHPNDGVTYVRNAPDINAVYAAERPSYKSLKAWLDKTWVSGQAVPHPSYADFAAFPDTFDIGLVLLSTPIDVPVYGVLPGLGQFDYLDTAKASPSERMVQIVGYGLVGKIPAFADYQVWERQFGYSTIINTGDSANVGDQNFMYTNNPGYGNGVGGTCSGDSGGPAFWVDPASGVPTNVIVGVNSFGIAPLCNGNDYQFRTDTAAAQDFVTPYLTWRPRRR
ncbi:MAG: trypsin-like serine protease [Acidimicrobiia bacterium]|nr:trypsin-like serine protease [Acidimicrobiia bacterium]